MWMRVATTESSLPAAVGESERQATTAGEIASAHDAVTAKKARLSQARLGAVPGEGDVRVTESSLQSVALCLTPALSLDRVVYEQAR